MTENNIKPTFFFRFNIHFQYIKKNMQDFKLLSMAYRDCMWSTENNS